MGDVEYQIVEAKRFHCGRMARVLCDGKWLSMKLGAVDPHARLVELWGTSTVRKVCLLDGAPVAMWGLTGTLLSSQGMVWMVLGRQAAAHPFAVIREVRKQLHDITALKREVHALIVEQDSMATRFAEFLGFVKAGEPMQMGDSGIRLVPMLLGG